MRDETLQEEFGQLLGQVARLWRRRVNDRLQPYGLTEATWRPLYLLSQAKEPMRQKQLAAGLQLDSSSVVRILDGLQSGGLVERREEEGDRRARALSLTPAGREIAGQIEQVAVQVRGEVLAGFDATELAVATHVLRVICELLAVAGEEAP